MKNKSTTDLRLVNILLIFGMTIALLVSMSSSQMMSASVEGGSPGPNNSNSNQGGSQASVPPNNADVSCEEDPMCGQAIDHINQAQSALQKGDTAGAQSHLDSAKKALLCEGCQPTN
jgi:hypothetical protein